ncbi:WecB/TagA/CpsF family glycosyltransferase [Crateriforma spongiae]|uniref:WecB/TagA/CpsF family glycosyltransferase n=1 Tax=Crateriforma spongiae TaxID=2724528 RepID=UPI001447165F|nr:WecB/TagA/CpsF family glycosyltransferase [Crateriforma spongiae]
MIAINGAIVTPSPRPLTTQVFIMEAARRKRPKFWLTTLTFHPDLKLRPMSAPTILPGSQSVPDVTILPPATDGTESAPGRPAISQNTGAYGPAVQQPDLETIRMSGTSIAKLTIGETLHRIAVMVHQRAGQTVIPVKLADLRRRHEDPQTANALDRAAFCVISSRIGNWRSRLAGTPMPERVCDTKLADAIARHSTDCGWRISVLGRDDESTENMIQKLRETGANVNRIHLEASAPSNRLRSRLPGVNTRPHCESKGRSVEQQLQQHSPDVLLVALPRPDALHWIAAHHNALNVPVCLPVDPLAYILSGGPWLVSDRWQTNVIVGAQRSVRIACEWLRRIPSFAADSLFVAERLCREWCRMVSRWGMWESEEPMSPGEDRRRNPPTSSGQSTAR